MKNAVKTMIVLALSVCMLLSFLACGPSGYTFAGQFNSPGSDAVAPFTMELSADKKVVLDALEYGKWYGTWTKNGDDLVITFSVAESDLYEDADYPFKINDENGLTFTAKADGKVYNITLPMAIDLTWYDYDFDLELTTAK